MSKSKEQQMADASQMINGAYALVNGLTLYYEIYGEGPPLILLHGGLGTNSMFGEVLSLLAQSHQVIPVELQGHGHTTDIDRPLRYELMADDVAVLIQHLGLEKVNLMGYSLGGGVALRTAIQHANLINKLVLVSTAFKRKCWYPKVLANMAQLNGSLAELMKPSPPYQEYVRIAPHPENFPRLLDKMGNLLRQDYDWTDEVVGLTMPIMLVYGDADSISPARAAEFFGLLGGGQRDGGLDGSGVTPSRLAVLPGKTHYDICYDVALATAVIPFLS